MPLTHCEMHDTIALQTVLYKEWLTIMNIFSNCKNYKSIIAGFCAEGYKISNNINDIDGVVGGPRDFCNTNSSNFRIFTALLQDTQPRFFFVLYPHPVRDRNLQKLTNLFDTIGYQLHTAYIDKCYGLKTKHTLFVGFRADLDILYTFPTQTNDIDVDNKVLLGFNIAHSIHAALTYAQENPTQYEKYYIFDDLEDRVR